ncbi:MAG: Re/Si-specific NAD(P)(+) transhydrogenase subunit alpha [Phycisphaerales bacterium]|nr:Re/Si-specific NAD(P)(+) transhydrogenase subunit alpha [Phycisphaerales bacterium]
MRIGIPREVHPEERRVAGTPETVIRLRQLGFEVLIETGAGEASGSGDSAYAEAGAAIAPTRSDVWACDIVLKVRPPQDLPGGGHEADLLREGGTLISFIWPAQNKALLDRLALRKANVLAMDCVPRITRAQKLDALSAMANLAGNRAVIEAAAAYPALFAGQITAAGTIDPARVFVVGAGVAGLAAVGAARALGAVVSAFDTRPEVAEQVKSMGAEFVPLDFKEEGAGTGGYAKQMSDAFLKAEQDLFARQALKSDIIITTALIPGRPAPRLITAGAVESMKPGSVIVDLAAEQGGNCALTRPGEAVRHKGVTIIGYTDLPGRLGALASRLYGANLAHFLEDLGGASSFALNQEDDVVRGALVMRGGDVLWPPKHPPAQPAVTTPTKRPETAAPLPGPAKPAPVKKRSLWPAVAGLLAGAALVAIGAWAPENFITHFTVFVLACFVGWQVVWNVTPALHTPLMSVTNAISGIILIGGMASLSGGPISAPLVLGAAAVFIATINIAGGFWVTNRMLAMFRN